jgi:DNA-binding transcriptional ArsR family regulator
MTEENNTLDDELAKIKQEMAEIKEILKNKEPEIIEDSNEHRSRRSRSRGKHRRMHIQIDPEEFDLGFDMDGVSDTMNDYVGNIMEGVQINLRRSLSQLSHKFGQEFGREFGDLRRESENLRKEGRRMAKEAKRAFRVEKRHGRYVKYQQLSNEELEKFYELAPNLTGALSDVRRLKILKELEKGPQYQGDLSENVDIKGGTLKHHLDTLMEVKYLYQEAARGRYLITQLGVEAVKLSEMLFRRFHLESTIKEFDDEDSDDEYLDDLDEEIDDKVEEFEDNIDEVNDSLDDFEDEYSDAIDDAKDSIDELADDLADKIEDKIESSNEDDE